MPKFKVGDRVRVTNVSDKHAWIKHLEGVSGVVKKVFKCANQDVGCYDIGLDYIINEPELELVKPKFKVGDKVRIIAANHSQDETLIGDIYTVDMVGASDCSYMLNDRCIYIWSEEELELVKPKIGDRVKIIGTIFEFKKHYIGDTREVINIHPPFNDGRGPRYVLKGADFIFYENELEIIHGGKVMKKEFTKKDLKNGDVVKKRDGAVEIVCVDTETLICTTGVNALDNIEYDLTSNIDRSHDIIAIRRPDKYHHCQFTAFERNLGTLVYERKKVEEMTLEEVCKALGKEIKIVKK